MSTLIYRAELLCAGILIVGISCAYGQENNKKIHIEDINSSNLLNILNLHSTAVDMHPAQSIIIQEGNKNKADVFLENDILISIQQGNSNNIYYRDKLFADPASMNISIIGDNNSVEILSPTACL
ncbi:hypothetical protein [Sphingobacterium spiritivorum]|uniref:hypothetical protein n=1 Tax=Sphingobacterium spiritivorum TaxID=258 RepID=UPI001F28B144|nr:hypothetical protein [Sphingobacterium spiritivorum]